MEMLLGLVSWCLEGLAERRNTIQEWKFCPMPRWTVGGSMKSRANLQDHRLLFMVNAAALLIT